MKFRFVGNKQSNEAFIPLFCLLLVTILFASCIIFDSDEFKQEHSLYQAKKLWSREIFGENSSLAPLVDGRYCYFPAKNIPGGGSNMTKIDLENGKVQWESSRIISTSVQSLHKIGAYIYQMTEFGYIFVFSDSDGKLAASVRLAEKIEDARYYAGGKYTAVSGYYLFWGNNLTYTDFPKGLLRFDTRIIDFSKVPDEIQIITPELAWSKQPRILSNILSEDGKIYFFGESSYNDKSEYIGILTAMDAETNTVIWERNMTMFEYRKPSLVLDGKNFLVIDRNPIFVKIGEDIFDVDYNNSCHDKNTGDIIFLNYNGSFSPDAYSSDFSEVVLYNNCIYYKANITYNDGDSEIVSLDAETGKLSSRTFYNGLISVPRLYKGKKYVLTSNGLWIDKSKIDRSIKGDQWSYTFIYKNSFIFNSQETYSNSIFLNAVKCD